MGGETRQEQTRSEELSELVRDGHKFIAKRLGLSRMEVILLGRLSKLAGDNDVKRVSLNFDVAEHHHYVDLRSPLSELQLFSLLEKYGFPEPYTSSVNHKGDKDVIRKIYGFGRNRSHWQYVNFHPVSQEGAKDN